MPPGVGVVRLEIHTQYFVEYYIVLRVLRSEFPLGDK